MHTDPVHHHHKHGEGYKKAESMMGMIMLIAVAVLAVGLIWALMQTGNAEPSWMR
jgi:hypothetical protein